MAIAVVIVDEGGLPVSIAPDDYGTPMIEADNGIGIAVTIVESGGLPVSGISAVIEGSPVLSVAPVISAPGGTAEIGETLSCTTGTWTNTPTSYAYQWRRGAANISGATSSTYVVVAADNAVGLRCRVTASNATGASSPANSNTLVVTDARPANTIAPVISGTDEVGQTLTSTTGTWTYAPTSYAYQWRRNGLAISGATASTYLTVSGDLGQAILCAVTASNAIGAAVTAAVSNVMTIEEETEPVIGQVVLTWDENLSDTTPNFAIDLPSGNGAPLDAAVGDVLVVQYSDDDGGTWSAYLSNTLDSGEIVGDTITQSGVTPLAPGEYLFRARIERDAGAAFGPWSDSEAAEVATAPSSPSYSFLGDDATDNATHVQTLSIDTGANDTGRYILICCSLGFTSSDPVSVTVGGVSLTKLVASPDPTTNQQSLWFYGGLVNSGTGAQNVVVTWTSASYLYKSLAAWRLDNLASSTVKATDADVVANNLTVSATAGDLLFYASSGSNLAPGVIDASTQVPDGEHEEGIVLFTADWIVDATGTFTIDQGPSNATTHAAVSFA